MSPEKETKTAPRRREPRSGPGGRKVNHLSAEALERKRANDRLSQRQIRQRTKERIEQLENRVKELTSQAENRDALAEENARLKADVRRLTDLLRQNDQAERELMMAGRSPFADPGENAPMRAAVSLLHCRDMKSNSLGACSLLRKSPQVTEVPRHIPPAIPTSSPVYPSQYSEPFPVESSSVRVPSPSMGPGRAVPTTPWHQHAHEPARPSSFQASEPHYPQRVESRLLGRGLSHGHDGQQPAHATSWAYSSPHLEHQHPPGPGPPPLQSMSASYQPHDLQTGSRREVAGSHPHADPRYDLGQQQIIAAEVAGPHLQNAPQFGPQPAMGHMEINQQYGSSPWNH